MATRFFTRSSFRFHPSKTTKVTTLRKNGEARVGASGWKASLAKGYFGYTAYQQITYPNTKPGRPTLSYTMGS